MVLRRQRARKIDIGDSVTDIKYVQKLGDSFPFHSIFIQFSSEELDICFF